MGWYLCGSQKKKALSRSSFYNTFSSSQPTNAKKICRFGVFFNLWVWRELWWWPESNKKELATEHKSTLTERSRVENNMILPIMRLGFYIWITVHISKPEPLGLPLTCYVFYSTSYLIYHWITSLQPLFPGYSCIRLGYLLHIHSSFLLIVHLTVLNSSQQGNCIWNDNPIYLPSVFHLINLYWGQNLMC